MPREKSCETSVINIESTLTPPFFLTSNLIDYIRSLGGKTYEELASG
jgi:hypothetical protein